MAEERDRELLVFLREASAAALEEWLEEHLSEVDVPSLRQIFRNPYVTSEILSSLVGEQRLASQYEVRKGLAEHPRTPQIHALRLVPTLFWRDIMELSLRPSVPPVVRRAGERQLITRLSGLAVGERMAIGRRAGHAVLQHLRFDGDRRVIGALLQNPRMTQGVLLPMVSHETTPPEILRLVAENRRWGVMYPIRLALVKNPRTPPVVAVSLVPRLKRMDLRAISRDRRIHAAVRRRAKELLGETTGPGGRR